MADRSVAAEPINNSPPGNNAAPGAFGRGRNFFKTAINQTSLRAWAQPITVFGFAMLMVTYSILAFLIVNSRTEATIDAKRQGANLARILDQSYSQMFQSVDSSLLFLRKAYRQSGPAFDISEWAQDASIRNDFAFNFTIADANGYIAIERRTVTAPRPGVKGFSIADRDYFREQANATADMLIISAPLTLKVSGSNAIVLARRLTAPDGSFAGIVSALVHLDKLGRPDTEIDLGPSGALGLVGLDGIVRTRAVDRKIDSATIGRQLPPGSSVLGRAAKAKNGSYWNTPGMFDDVSRLVTFQVLGDFPMIAVVSVAEAEIYRHANKTARIYWGIAILLTIAIMIAVRWGVIRELKLIAATSEMVLAQDAMRESQERYALVEAAVNDGIFDRNILTGEAYFSPRWKNILGYAEDELPDVSSTFFEHLHPDDKAIVSEAHRANVEENKPFEAVFRMRCKDGEYRWMHSRGNILRDAENRPYRILGTLVDITDRKQAEAELKESHDNLARAESMVQIGHYKYDKNSRTLTWSDGIYHIIGKSADSFTPTLNNTLELFHPDDRPAVERHRNDVMAGQNPPPFTSRMVKDDGQIAFVQSWSTPIYASDGKTAGYFGTVQDITERQREQAALKESLDNLARAEAMVHMGHFKHDLGSDRYIWSEGLYRMMGKSPDTFTPTLDATLQIVHPDDRAILNRYRNDVFTGIDVPSVTMRGIKDDGSVIYVELWSAPTRASDGTVTGMFGTTRDVTARRQAENLMEETLTNLERAERMALLGHYKIDRDTDTLIWSEGVYRILGLSPDRYTPTLDSALEFIHPDDRLVLKQFRQDAMSGHEIPHVILRAIRKDGRVIELEYWSAPVRDGNGVVIGTFGTVQDVTIRRKAEYALEQANTELEARVSERTAELANEMRRREEAQMTLAQMQKMEVVGQLTAGIAHDFNNLLAVIGGSLEFVDGAAARGLTAEPELIDAALRATRRGRELVKRLLAFARQSPLRAEATTIDQLVLDTLRLLQRTLGQGIDMVTQLDAKAAVISVDRNQLANALLNLALNARDAMADGGQLTIATKCQPVSSDADKDSPRWPTGEEVCITISDTGAGMTKVVRARAFEPFFTTKADGLGSGLGLSMVQGFVEQSGGHIEIDSGEGRGTTVTIKLPRIASESQAEETDPATGLTMSGREKTVLLVEDDPDVRIVTAAQLKQLGYKVHAVNDGMAAIDLIASPATIDITLTDIVLPGGLDGVALVKEAMRARPKMGVLCMSGYDPTQKHRKWLKIQNIVFLEKPFSSNRLAQALNDALAH